MSDQPDVVYGLLINKQRLDCLLEDLGDEAVQCLLGIYKTELTEKLELITNHLDHKAFELLEYEAHTLRSASQNLGIDQISEMMAEIEQAAIECNLEKARLSFQQAFKYHGLVQALERLG